MLKTCFSLALTAICYCCITNSHTNPSALKWYLTCASNNSFSDKKARALFLVFCSRLIQGQVSESAKASSGWGPMWRCPVSADRAHSDSLSHRALSIMGITITSTGPDAATGHDLCLSQVLLLSKSAVSCYCHNVLLSSQHTPATLAPINCYKFCPKYMGLCGKP